MSTLSRPSGTSGAAADGGMSSPSSLSSTLRPPAARRTSSWTTNLLQPPFLTSLFGSRKRTQNGNKMSSPTNSATVRISNVTKKNTTRRSKIIFEDDEDEEEEDEMVDIEELQQQISHQDDEEDLNDSHYSSTRDSHPAHNLRDDGRMESTETATPTVLTEVANTSKSSHPFINNALETTSNANGNITKRRRVCVEPVPNNNSRAAGNQQQLTTGTTALFQQHEIVEVHDSSVSSMSTASRAKIDPAVSPVGRQRRNDKNEGDEPPRLNAALQPAVQPIDQPQAAIVTDCGDTPVGDEADELHEHDDNGSVTSMSTTTSSSSTDSQPPDLPPKVDALKYQCWKCSVPFRQEGGAFCFYAMHVHPVLEVPICFVCSRQVMEAATSTTVKDEADEGATNRNRRASGEDDDNDGGCCLGCGDDEEDVDVLFCCDFCPATFCDVCVAKAYGGGQESLKTTQELQQSDDEWRCPKCQPPLPLHELQEFVQGVSKPDANSKDNASPSRTREQVLEEYLKVEEERELVDWYLSPERCDQKRREIRKELQNKRKRASPQQEEEEEEEELEEEVEHEMRLWEQQLQDHDARLQDMSTSLQDEMGAMNVAIPYVAIPELEKKADQGEEPAWKRQADLECMQRDVQEKAQAGKTMIPTKHEEKWDEVEDLRTSDLDNDESCTDDPERSQWRSSAKVQKEDLEEMTRLEDELLRERNITISRRISDDQDAQNILSEDRQASSRGSEGVARVRRDDYQHLQGTIQRQQRKRVGVSKKTNPINKKTAPMASAAAVADTKTKTSDAGKSPARLWRLVPTPKSDRASVKRKSEQGSLKNDEGQNRSAKRRLIKTFLDDSDDDSAESAAEKHSLIVDSADASSETSAKMPANSALAAKSSNRNDGKARSSSAPTNRQLSRRKDSKRLRKSLGSGLTSCSPVVLDETPPSSPTRMDDDDDGSSSSSDKKDIFCGSTLILAASQAKPSKSRGKAGRLVVTIAEPLARKLKPHQKEGVQFIWNNSFSDLFPTDENTPDDSGGCILAHNMGLGKTLTCISLLHCILNNPLLTSTTGSKPAIRTALIVVPVNTIANWDAEFEMWTGSLHPSIRVINLGAVEATARRRNIRSWTSKGGVLLISDKTFLRVSKDFFEELVSPGPDVIVLDEAHVMVKNAETGIFKALSKVETKRRIALTGSPVQNNLLEYYRMVSWVRPGVLGTVGEFEEGFIVPINTGLPSDASEQAIHLSNEKSAQLYELLSPFVQRKDASVLKDEVPPMQQVVLHIRPSKLQTHFYRAAKHLSNKNFFKLFQALKPIHNHPGCLLMKPSGQGQAGTKESQTESANDQPIIQEQQNEDSKKRSVDTLQSELDINRVDSNAERKTDQINMDKSDLAEASSSLQSKQENLAAGVDQVLNKNKVEWWMKIAKHHGLEKMKDIKNGSKIVLFLHILVLAHRNGEKVMLFTKCCKTLDFIEEVLNLEDWGSHLQSLRSELGTDKMGNWRKNVDFLRIDGQVGSGERGELVAKFNDVNQSADHAKLFLISKAGGIGVNLVAASRVVLFDCDINPTVNTQALFRCYRYGQTKPVFAYLFLTEGSMEEKIYSRCVTKTGMALRVVDKKTINRCFSAREISDLSAQDLWIECSRCQKWRMLPPQDTTSKEDVPDQWFCEMLQGDEINNNCEASEKNEAWYYAHQQDVGADNPTAPQTDAGAELPDLKKAQLVAQDSILQKILHISAESVKSSPTKEKAASHRRKATASTGKSLLISKYYFHEKLLEEAGVVDKGLNSPGGLGARAKDEKTANSEQSLPSGSTSSKTTHVEKAKSTAHSKVSVQSVSTLAKVAATSTQEVTKETPGKSTSTVHEENTRRNNVRKSPNSKLAQKAASVGRPNAGNCTPLKSRKLTSKSESPLSESGIAATSPKRSTKRAPSANRSNLIRGNLNSQHTPPRSRENNLDSTDNMETGKVTTQRVNISKASRMLTSKSAACNTDGANAARAGGNDQNDVSNIESAPESAKSDQRSPKSAPVADQPNLVVRNIQKSPQTLVANAVADVRKAPPKKASISESTPEVESTSVLNAESATKSDKERRPPATVVGNLEDVANGNQAKPKHATLSPTKIHFPSARRKLMASKSVKAEKNNNVPGDGISRHAASPAHCNRPTSTGDDVSQASSTSRKPAALQDITVPSNDATRARLHQPKQAPLSSTNPYSRSTELVENTRPSMQVIEILDSDEDVSDEEFYV